jgi:hypothetical protein
MGARNRVGLGLSYQPARARSCKRLWSPGIDSEESISPAYVAWGAGTTNRIVVPASQAGNQFLGSLKVLKYRHCATVHREVFPLLQFDKICGNINE